MYSYDDISSRSESDELIIVAYADAMELLHLYESESISIFSWEGWLKHSDGELVPSKRHQCRQSLSSLPSASAFALARSTIMQSHSEWGAKPEVPDAELLFSITVNT